jgi:hypothetical protein
VESSIQLQKLKKADVWWKIDIHWVDYRIEKNLSNYLVLKILWSWDILYINLIISERKINLIEMMKVIWEEQSICSLDSLIQRSPTFMERFHTLSINSNIINWQCTYVGMHSNRQNCWIFQYLMETKQKSKLYQKGINKFKAIYSKLYNNNEVYEVYFIIN